MHGCRAFYLAWLVLATMLLAPRAVMLIRQRGQAYSSGLQQQRRQAIGPLLLLQLAWQALGDMAACPVLWWPQVSSHGLQCEQDLPAGRWLLQTRAVLAAVTAGALTQSLPTHAACTCCALQTSSNTMCSWHRHAVTHGCAGGMAGRHDAGAVLCGPHAHAAAPGLRHVRLGDLSLRGRLARRQVRHCWRELCL